MSTPPATNRFGQPIGPPLQGWTAPPAPAREGMVGRLCRLEPLSAERHADALFDADALDAEGRSWTYLAYGPFASRADYRRWVEELTAATADVASIATHFGPTTAAPGEKVELPEGTVVPVLSPRERDVLYELARGSTYADIAASLFVSENTVKTHVSSLYGKLSVNRRSAALAAARSMHLL